jgi:predicted nucleic acid-binding protein
MGRDQGVLFDDFVLIDTSAVVALLNQSDKFHSDASQFLGSNKEHLRWHSVNVTAHETFTRLRYDHDLRLGLTGYAFLRDSSVTVIHFDTADDKQA